MNPVAAQRTRAVWCGDWRTVIFQSRPAFEGASKTSGPVLWDSHRQASQTPGARVAASRLSRAADQNGVSMECTNSYGPAVQEQGRECDPCVTASPEQTIATPGSSTVGWARGGRQLGRGWSLEWGFKRKVEGPKQCVRSILGSAGALAEAVEILSGASRFHSDPAPPIFSWRQDLLSIAMRIPDPRCFCVH